jgi:hypothetical protein
VERVEAGSGTPPFGRGASHRPTSISQDYFPGTPMTRSLLPYDIPQNGRILHRVGGFGRDRPLWSYILTRCHFWLTNPLQVQILSGAPRAGFQPPMY